MKRKIINVIKMLVDCLVDSGYESSNSYIIDVSKVEKSNLENFGVWHDYDNLECACLAGHPIVISYPVKSPETARFAHVTRVSVFDENSDFGKYVAFEIFDGDKIITSYLQPSEIIS